jgi:glycosyltransferase involved in cell wall biosynthesis
LPHISVVIPVYKNEGCLYDLASRLKASLETISRDFEIIMVEDCGGDRSWEIIKELASQDPRVRGLQFSRNFGQHNAITAGLDHCQGDWAVAMDADLQDRPEEIPKLYHKALEGYDVVLAKKIKRKDRLSRKWSSYIFAKVFSYFSGMKYDYRVGNFRIISRKVVDYYCLMREKMRFFGGLVEWMGFPAAEVEVLHNRELHGKSTYTLRKLLKLAGEAIVSYSDLPLRIAVKIGLSISFLSFVFGIYIVVRAIVRHNPVPGWTSLFVSLYFLGGIIIASLGIIGLYLGKTFDEIKKRPLYIIRDSTFHEKTP